MRCTIFWAFKDLEGEDADLRRGAILQLAVAGVTHLTGAKFTGTIVDSKLAKHLKSIGISGFVICNLAHDLDCPTSPTTED